MKLKRHAPSNELLKVEEKVTHTISTEVVAPRMT